MKYTFNKLFSFFIFISMFSSCKNEDKSDLTVLTSLDHALVTSSLNIESSNHIIYASLASKALDPRTAQKANVWQPKALMIKSLSDKEYNYIEQLKSELKKQAGSSIENGIEVFDKENRNAVTVIYNKYGTELLKKMNEYKISVLEVDQEFKSTFENTIPVTFPGMNDQLAFKDNYFRNVTTISALATLSCFQNKTRNTENMLITFCHERVNTSFCGFNSRPQPLVSLNSSYIKGGEKVIITAGVGSFSTAMMPVFTIAGKKISINDEGVVVYERKASSVPGKYKVPVIIEFIDENGNTETMSKEVIYEVAKDSTD